MRWRRRTNELALAVREKRQERVVHCFLLSSLSIPFVLEVDTYVAGVPNLAAFLPRQVN